MAGTESLITDSKKSSFPCVFLFAMCICISVAAFLIFKNLFCLVCFKSGTTIILGLNIFD